SAGGRACYLPRPAAAADPALMRRIVALHPEHPFAGSRMLKGLLRAEEHEPGRLHVCPLRKGMASPALCRPNTSKPVPGHKISPCLVRHPAVTGPGQAWAMDITSIPMARGFVHLTAVLGWFSRKVLARRLAITRSPDFCIETLKDALGRSGRPEIFNSDQGSQFTGVAFITALKNARVAISMDGRGSAHTPRARQRLRRAALADGEPKDRAAKYRGGVPAPLRQRLRDRGLDWPLCGLLQQHQAAFVARRADA
ncbi:DDE-type integrase/transposase/recombinase, partial [Paracoccus sp. MC1854]|nr:DDE-type integrase/transposase/recombinase [Paracoccus sp. MC1854]